eukprot:GABV01008590.1.p1 GENE.GABV01008590.1~~GABV01008590.1.p1  ORF type:complete len:299 (+),score=69.72 GABV01008590.1:212-1108(+)
MQAELASQHSRSHRPSFEDRVFEEESLVDADDHFEQHRPARSRRAVSHLEEDLMGDEELERQAQFESEMGSNRHRRAHTMADMDPRGGPAQVEPLGSMNSAALGSMGPGMAMNPGLGSIGPGMLGSMGPGQVQAVGAGIKRPSSRATVTTDQQRASPSPSPFQDDYVTPGGPMDPQQSPHQHFQQQQQQQFQQQQQQNQQQQQQFYNNGIDPAIAHAPHRRTRRRPSRSRRRPPRTHQHPCGSHPLPIRKSTSHRSRTRSATSARSRTPATRARSSKHPSRPRTFASRRRSKNRTFRI